MKITIIGNGQIGNAILYLLKESKKNDPKFLIEIYDKDDLPLANLLATAAIKDGKPAPPVKWIKKV